MAGEQIAAILAAAAVLVTAITGLIVAIRSLKAEVATVKGDIGQVHQIVNSRTDEQIARIDQLEQVITGSTPDVLPPRRIPGQDT